MKVHLTPTDRAAIRLALHLAAEWEESLLNTLPSLRRRDTPADIRAQAADCRKNIREFSRTYDHLNEQGVFLHANPKASK